MADQEKAPKDVRVGKSVEYPHRIGRRGQIIGTIPPDSKEPIRLIVRLVDGPVLNFLPGDIELLKS